MEEDEVNKAIIDLCKEHNSRDELEGFFDSCKIRVRKMSPPIRSAVQHQISTILFNAENPNFQQALMPLPIQDFVPGVVSMQHGYTSKPLTPTHEVSGSYSFTNL